MAKRNNSDPCCYLDNSMSPEERRSAIKEQCPDFSDRKIAVMEVIGRYRGDGEGGLSAHQVNYLTEEILKLDN